MAPLINSMLFGLGLTALRVAGAASQAPMETTTESLSSLPKTTSTFSTFLPVCYSGDVRCKIDWIQVCTGGFWTNAKECVGCLDEVGAFKCDERVDGVLKENISASSGTTGTTKMQATKRSPGQSAATPLPVEPCNPGDKMCHDEVVLLCLNEMRWVAYQQCWQDEVCLPLDHGTDADCVATTTTTTMTTTTTDSPAPTLATRMGECETQMRCFNNTVEHCNGDEQYVLLDTCNESQLCLFLPYEDEALCLSIPHEPGQCWPDKKRCTNNTVEGCNYDNTWSVLDECDETEFCLATSDPYNVKCFPKDTEGRTTPLSSRADGCDPLSMRCIDSTAEICINDSEWLPVADCSESDFECEETSVGGYVLAVCLPYDDDDDDDATIAELTARTDSCQKDTMRCNDNSVEACGSDGRWFVVEVCIGDLGEVCVPLDELNSAMCETEPTDIPTPTLAATATATAAAAEL